MQISLKKLKYFKVKGEQDKQFLATKASKVGDHNMLQFTVFKYLLEIGRRIRVILAEQKHEGPALEKYCEISAKTDHV